MAMMLYRKGLDEGKWKEIGENRANIPCIQTILDINKTFNETGCIDKAKKGEYVINFVLFGCHERKLTVDINHKGIPGKNGMLSLFINSYENNPFFIHKKLFQTLSDTFHQNAFETINNDKSKLRTYAIFKKDIGFEKYLSNIKNPTRRALLTKFRLSNHKLIIEVGRYTNIPKEMRFCHFCPNMAETEAHFLFYCIA